MDRISDIGLFIVMMTLLGVFEVVVVVVGVRIVWIFFTKEKP